MDSFDQNKDGKLGKDELKMMLFAWAISILRKKFASSQYDEIKISNKRDWKSFSAQPAIFMAKSCVLFFFFFVVFGAKNFLERIFLII